MRPYDILIKNGIVVEREIPVRRPIAIRHGFIVPCEDANNEAKRVIDARGYYVVPGLIDAHVHTFFQASDLGIPADLSMIPQGVTAVVDAGTSGVANYQIFLSQNRTQLVKSKVFLNVSPGGIATYQYREPIVRETWSQDAFAEAIERSPNEILGLKLRLSRDIVKTDVLVTLDKAAQMAHNLGIRLCIHVTNTEYKQTEFLRFLEKGDIYCHMYHGTGETILDEQGRVYEEFFLAQEKGIIMDAASGKFNFSCEVARAAMEQGFLPDIISSDATKSNLFFEYVECGLPYIMSRFLALGMEPEQIFDRVTRKPAQLLGLEGGSLEEGMPADVSIFELKEHRTIFRDIHGVLLQGEKLFVPKATVVNGNLMYKQIDF